MLSIQRGKDTFLQSDLINRVPFLRSLFQEIDYEGFRKFLNSYLEIDTPDELCRHLFLSFVKKSARGVDSKAFKVRIAISD